MNFTKPWFLFLFVPALLSSCATNRSVEGTRIPMAEREIRFVMPEERLVDVMSVLKQKEISHWEERFCMNDDCGVYRCAIDSEFACHWTEEASGLRKFIAENPVKEAAEPVPVAAAADPSIPVTNKALANCETFGASDSSEARRACIDLLWRKYAGKDMGTLEKKLLPFCADGQVYCNLSGERIGGRKVRPRYPSFAKAWELNGDIELEYSEKE